MSNRLENLCPQAGLGASASAQFEGRKKKDLGSLAFRIRLAGLMIWLERWNLNFELHILPICSLLGPVLSATAPQLSSVIGDDQQTATSG